MTHLNSCDGVMIGRSIYQNPYSLVEIEKEIFKTARQSNKRRGSRTIIRIFRKRG